MARRAVAALFVGVGVASAAGVAAAAESTCKLVKVAEWALRPGRVTPVVDGAINNRSVGVLIDTGAMRTTMARSTAIALGLERTRAAGGARMLGVGGTTTVEVALIQKLEIGDAVRTKWLMPVAGEREMGEIGVVLGADFLQHADIEFDLAHDAIRLFQAKDCQGASLAYWAAGDAGQVKIEAFDPARAEIGFMVQVNGRSIRAKLDSGAFASVIMESAAASLGVTPASAGVVAAGCLAGAGRNTIESWFGAFESFSIGDEIIRNPRIRFTDVLKFRPYTFTFGEPDMLLGADFLRSHRVLVAHSQRRMYFTYTAGTVFPFSTEPVKCGDRSRQASEDKPSVGAN